GVDHCATAGPIAGLKVDRKAPGITITAPADGAVYLLGQPVAAAYGCADGGSGLTNCAGTVANTVNVDTLTVGTKTFKVDSADGAGNLGTRTVTYTVRYDFAGFFRPVDNKDGSGNYILNVVKAGSAVPIKFSLGGNKGLNIMTSGYPTSKKIACGDTPTTDTIESTVTAGSSSLSYDATTDQYTYVWKTDKNWATDTTQGPCRQLVVKLADGQSYFAVFKFTRT
nr:PxKF domain-containing protein [Actinomycetota bacterium]